MKRNTVYFKIVSIILSVTFFYQQISWAQENLSLTEFDVQERISKTIKSKFERFTIPKNLAQVEKQNFNGNEECVINIQDAHASLSAQYSIVRILDELLANYDVETVAIEGAEGYINTSILSSFPDEKAREKTASYMMKKGKISAGEFFSVMKGNDVALYGAEDSLLYKKNLESFRKIYLENRENVRFVKNLQKELQHADERIYSPVFQKYLFKSRLHREGKISFTLYWDFLNGICGELGMTPDADENVRKFLDAAQIERTINFKSATIERKTLIDRMVPLLTQGEMKELVLKSLYFEEGRISEPEYYRWLTGRAKERGITGSDCPNLGRYIQYLEYCESLDIAALEAELVRLEKGLVERLLSGREAQTLYKLEKMTDLLVKLFEIRLSAQEARYLSGNLGELAAEDFFAFLTDDNTPDVSRGELIKTLDRITEVARESLGFYEIVEKRNRAMLANTIDAMRREGKKAAALVSGGHHSDGLAQLMREKGLSYMIVMPKFSKDVERPYVAILTKKEGPYRKLIESGEYDLALEAYFDSGDIYSMEEMIVYTLGQAALEGMDVESKLGGWIESYRQFYNDIPPERRETMVYEPVKPQDLKDFLRSVKLQMAGDGVCRVYVGDRTYQVTETGMSVTDLQKGISRKEIASGAFHKAVIMAENFHKYMSKTGFPDGVIRNILEKSHARHMLSTIPAIKVFEEMTGKKGPRGSGFLKRTMLIVFLLIYLFSSLFLPFRGAIAGQAVDTGKPVGFHYSRDQLKETIEIKPDLFTIRNGNELYLDLRSTHVPGIPYGSDGADLSGYAIEFIFSGGENVHIQLFLKDREFKSICARFSSTRDNRVRFDPATDGYDKKEFSDLRFVYTIGATVWGDNINEVKSKLTGVRLVRVRSGFMPVFYHDPDDVPRVVIDRAMAMPEPDLAVSFYERPIPLKSTPVSIGEFARYSGVSLYLDKATYGYDIGGENGFSQREEELKAFFGRLKANNWNVVRIFTFGDLAGPAIRYDSWNRPAMIDAKALEDFKALIRAANSAGVKLIPVLFDFKMADNAYQDAKGGRLGERPDVIVYQENRERLLTLMRGFLEELRDYMEANGLSDTVLAFESLNEPECMYVKGFNTLPYAQSFVAEFTDILREVFPGKPVSFSMQQSKDMSNWRHLFRRGDIVAPHWYPKFDTEGTYSSLNRPFGELNLPEGVIVIYGEAPPTDVSDVLGIVYRNGYRGLLFWHDDESFNFINSPEKKSEYKEWFKTGWEKSIKSGWVPDAIKAEIRGMLWKIVKKVSLIVLLPASIIGGAWFLRKYLVKRKIFNIAKGTRTRKSVGLHGRLGTKGKKGSALIEAILALTGVGALALLGVYAYRKLKTMGVSEDSYEIVIGLPLSVCKYIGPENLKRIEGAGIVSTVIALDQSRGEKYMLEEMKAETGGFKCISGIISEDVIREDMPPYEAAIELEKIIRAFAERAREDIYLILRPDVMAISEKEVAALSDKEGLKDMMKILVRRQPDAESLELNEKSIYDLRIENLYDMNVREFGAAERKYMQHLMTATDEDVERRVLVTAIDNVFDMRLLAESIERRRMALPESEAADDPIKDVVVLRNDKLAGKLKECLLITGLGEFIDAANVIVVKEGEVITPEKVMEKINREMKINAKPCNIAMGQRSGIIGVNVENPGELFSQDNPDSLLFVQMKDGLVGQLYKVMLEVISNDEGIPRGLPAGELKKIMIDGKTYRVFKYLPNIVAIDIEAEVRNYERYVFDVLVKA